MNSLIRWTLVPAVALTTVSGTMAQEREAREDAPLSDAFRSSPEDVREYQEHLIILASPWMGGRLPGTRGAELAREYVESEFKSRGLKPVMNVTEDGAAGYRQPFPLGSPSELVEIGGSFDPLGEKRRKTLTLFGASERTKEPAFAGWFLLFISACKMTCIT